MSTLSSLPLLVLLSLGACAVDEASESTDERADSNEVIEYRKPDAPIAIEIDPGSATLSSHSIAYGHCEDAQVDAAGEIHISCPSKWSELAWLSISNEATQALLAEGKSRLTFDIAIPGATIEGESVRFAVRSVADDGSNTKLVSEANLLDGASIELDLKATQYEIFMARGVNSFLIWENGVVEVELSARAE